MRKKFRSGSAKRDEGVADPADAWNTLRICYDGPADARRGSASTGRETHDAQSCGMEAQTKRLETVTSLVLTHAGFKIYNFARCVPAWVVGVRSAGPPPPMTALRCLVDFVYAHHDQGRSAHRYSWRWDARACSSGRAHCRVKLVTVVKHAEEKTGKPEKPLRQRNLASPTTNNSRRTVTDRYQQPVLASH